jgi:hypothetical protein
MADDERVILGKKGSDYGLWVTKTGVSFTDNPTTKDLLFDSNVAETGGLVLKTGTTTFAFSGNQPNTSSSFVYYNLDGSNGSLGYIPMILFARVDGNNVYPFNTQHQWNMEIPHPSNPAADPGTSNGVMWDNYAQIYDDKFKIFATRWMQAGMSSPTVQPSYFNTTDAITIQYAVLAIGGATAE